MKNKINTEFDYKDIMSRINNLMAKGSKNVTDDELAEIQELALAAQKYEQDRYTDFLLQHA